VEVPTATASDWLLPLPEKLPVAPEGKPLTLQETAAEKPLAGETLTEKSAAGGVVLREASHLPSALLHSVCTR